LERSERDEDEVRRDARNHWRAAQLGGECVHVVKPFYPKLILQRESAVFSVLDDLDGGALDGNDFDAVDRFADAERFAIENDGPVFQAVEN